jgi:hypothetical protein
MYDLLKSLLCGIFGVRHNSIVFSLSPYNLIGLCGAHRWGDSAYILATYIAQSKYGSRGMSPAI